MGVIRAKHWDLHDAVTKKEYLFIDPHHLMTENDGEGVGVIKIVDTVGVDGLLQGEDSDPIVLKGAYGNRRILQMMPSDGFFCSEGDFCDLGSRWCGCDPTEIDLFDSEPISCPEDGTHVGQAPAVIQDEDTF